MSEVHLAAGAEPHADEIAAPGPDERPRSLGRDAWEDLRRRPLVIVSVAVIAVLVVMAIAPGLFTDTDPNATSILSEGATRLQGPSADAWFGTDQLGRDIYARTIYGARASILVGLLATTGILVIGGLLGLLCFYGGAIDSLISRLTDIVFGIPFLLGAIIVLSTFPSGPDTDFLVQIFKVVAAFLFLAWPPVLRLMRSAVFQVKSSDYVAAAQALGAGGPRILRTHVLPNAVQPVIVYGTIALGVIIGAEAALSFLGIGLQGEVVSWGQSISEARRFLRSSPHLLFFPALFLSITILAFIMLGDAVRDALDPKLR